MERPNNPPAGMPARITDAEREHVASLLQQACGEGRLTLDEFTLRVGAVWSADTPAELAQVTEGLQPPPPVGISRTRGTIISLLSDHTHTGRWRLPRRLRVWAILGATRVDLRDAMVSAEVARDGVITISALSILGDVRVTVPEGVEVEHSGVAVVGERRIALAPVPRRPGTPLLRIHANAVVGVVHVESKPPAERGTLPDWVRSLFPPHRP